MTRDQSCPCPLIPDQVWLAALRETEKQDSSEQHVICEDHFLPEDISSEGVADDAIPIMPPYMDGLLNLVSLRGAESSEEEEAGLTGGEEDDDDATDESQPPQVTCCVYFYISNMTSHVGITMTTFLLSCMF